MKFFISGLGLDIGGGRTVGLNVLRSLPQVDRENRYCLVFPQGCGYEDVPLSENCELKVVKVNPKPIHRPYLDHCWLPNLCRRWGADAALSMSNFGPWRMPCPHLVGVHVPHFFYPDNPLWRFRTDWLWLKLRAGRSYFQHQVKRVDGFCVLTDVLADRLHRLYGVPRRRIAVIPNAVASEVSSPLQECAGIDEKMMRHEHRLKLCYVAPFYAHKNHGVLIPAMKILREEYGIEDTVVFITVKEDGDRGEPGFLKKLGRAGLERQIVNLGFLPLAATSRVYARCHGLLMPTLLECFSNTYVEAMHFELPILTSDMDFAKIVCGEGALYFDPMDPRAVARAIKEFHDRPGLRRVLQREGKRRLKELGITWEEVTRRYVDTLHRAAEGRNLQDKDSHEADYSIVQNR